MRFSFTLILLLSFVSLVIGQNKTSESQSEEEDRRRLENQFKALKNFYINDQGLVVYQTQSSDAHVVEDYNEYAASNPVDTLVVFVDEFSTTDTPPVYDLSASGNTFSEPEITNSQEYNSPEFISSTPANTDNSTTVNPVSINKRPVNPVFFGNARTETANVESVGTPSERPTEARTEAIVEETRTTVARPVSRPIITGSSATSTPPASALSKASKAEQNYAKETIKENKAAEEKVLVEEKKTTPASPSKKSVFAKDPTKYKTLEEAAMAAQELLDKLKTEDSGTSKPGSLSSRLSKGAGNSSLRKEQSSVNNSFASGRGNRPMISEKTVEAEKQYEEASTPYTVEPVPTYYINGVEVDKSVVDKLRKADILSREVRSRNTQSGNPAGEVWIQLK